MLQAEVLPVVEKGDDAVVIKQLQDGNSVSWFFEGRLLHLAQKLGKKTYVSPGRVDSLKQPVFFEVRPLRLRVEYLQVPGRSRSLVRQVQSGFYLKVVRGSAGEVLLSREVWGKKSDIILEENIASYENPELAFTIGQKVKSTSRVRWLQPVLISGVAGVVVYLFYSLRSR